MTIYSKIRKHLHEILKDNEAIADFICLKRQLDIKSSH